MICSAHFRPLKSPGRKVTALKKMLLAAILAGPSECEARFIFYSAKHPLFSSQCDFCPMSRQLNPLSYRWSCGAAAWAGRERDPSHPEAQQRDHLDGTQRERRPAAPAGDEDKDEDQQGGGGETGAAQTGETSLHMWLRAGCTSSATIVKITALAHKGPFLLAQFVTFCNRKHAFHQQQSWRICLWLCSNASTVSLV